MNVRHLERHPERRLKLCAYGLLVLVQVLAGNWNAYAERLLRQAAGPPSAEQRLQLQADPYVMRWRMAHMDSDALFRAGPSSAPLALDLFRDVPLKAQVRSAKTLESGSSFLFGTVEGGGHFTLLRTSGGIVRGEFDSAQGFYKLRSDGSGPNRVLVKQHDRSRFPGCGFDSEAGARTVASHKPIVPLGVRNATSATARTLRRPTSQTPADLRTSNPIDILVLYDQPVEDREGGTEELQATIEYFFSYANQMLANSGLSHRKFRLAAMEKTEGPLQDEDGRALNLNIQNVDGTAVDQYSGVPPSVFSLFSEYGAGQVHVLVAGPLNTGTKENPSFVCGYAGLGPIHPNSEYRLRLDCSASENYALCLRNGRREEANRPWIGQTGRHSWSSFQTTSTLWCADAAYVFIHELGHSLSIKHHRTSAISRSTAQAIYAGKPPVGRPCLYI